MFSENRSRACRKYLEFMDDGISVKKQDVYATIDQRLLGDDRFVDRIVEEHGKPVEKERRRREYSLAAIAGAVGQVGDISIDALRGSGRMREVSRGRSAFTVIAHGYGYRGTEIAEYLRKDPTAITQYARKGEEVQEIIAKVEKVLEAKR